MDTQTLDQRLRADAATKLRVELRKAANLFKFTMAANEAYNFETNLHTRDSAGTISKYRASLEVVLDQLVTTAFEKQCAAVGQLAVDAFLTKVGQLQQDVAAIQDQLQDVQG